MPAGDPAGYLPNVVKARLKRGQRPYQPRVRSGKGKGVRRLKPSLPKGDARTGGTEAPVFGNGRGFKPINPSAVAKRKKKLSAAMERLKKQRV